MEQPKRIVLVTPKLTAGGTERAVSVLANELAERGDEVTLILMYAKERFFETAPEVEVVEPTVRRSRFGKVFYTFFLLFFIRREVRKVNPDVVFAVGYIAFTLLATLGLSTKVVFSRRCNPTRPRFPGKPVLNRLYAITHRLLRPRVDGIIAQTEAAAGYYRERYACEVAVVPNFVRTIQPYDLPKKNYIITVGRLVWEKAQHYLIEAFSRLDAPDWKLLLVGDGPRKEELEKQARQLKLEDRVLFLGFRKDVDRLLSQSRIFAFTSVNEGFPNALLEGMATPLPVVSFDCEAGPADVIRDGQNGFLVEVGDTDTFSDRLQFLIDHEAARERMGAEALKIREEYSMDRLVDAYRSFLVKPVREGKKVLKDKSMVRTP